MAVAVASVGVAMAAVAAVAMAATTVAPRSPSRKTLVSLPPTLDQKGGCAG